MTAVAFIVPGFHVNDSGDTPVGAPRLCTWDELKIMHDSGHVDIQSHTYEHRYVPRWPEPIPITGADSRSIDILRGPDQAISDDFRLARSTIESKIGKKVHHLAFVKFEGSDDAIEIGLDCGYRSFWWGYLPNHDGNCPGQSTSRIARLDAIYLRRLPGNGRRSLTNILTERFGSRLSQSWRRIFG